MEGTTRPPQSVRERVDRLGGGRLACAVIFDREFTPEEVRRIAARPGDGAPAASDFRFEGRVVRYECAEDDEARWRLALEILLVKALRERRESRPTGDLRARMGLRPIPR
ncbi:MAG TPA: hypothetical protein VFA98_13560 [Thermoanaerobaculia bacterium]|nr:hypothetical protein [Thermoanaerobaculia bacterium]